MDEKIKVLVVDDDNLVAISLKTILETDEKLQVVGIGKDGTDAIKMYEEHKPDVLLMDIQMKDVSGLEAAEKILQLDSKAKILLLTTFSDNKYIVNALRIGTKGYILKQDFESIIPSVLAVNNGQSVFGGEIMARIPSLYEKGTIKEESDDLKSKLEMYELTEKELSVIKVVADGLNNKEIADELCLSEGTVRNYISTILEKLQLRDRTQLAIFYLSERRPPLL